MEQYPAQTPRSFLNRFFVDPFRRDRAVSEAGSGFGDNPGYDMGWPSAAGSSVNAFPPCTRPSGPRTRIVGLPLLDVMNSLWEGQARSALSTVDVKETAKTYVFQADAPGFEQEDLKVQVDDVGPGNDHFLVISGTKQMQSIAEEDGLPASSRSIGGTFIRRFRLPSDADPDAITAHCENGDLTVVVPKHGVIPDPRFSLENARPLRVEEIESEEDEELERQEHSGDGEGAEFAADNMDSREELNAALAAPTAAAALVSSSSAGNGSAAAVAAPSPSIEYNNPLQDSYTGRELNPDVAEVTSSRTAGTPVQAGAAITPAPEGSVAVLAQPETPPPRIVEVLSAPPPADVRDVEVVGDESDVDFSFSEPKAHHHRSRWRRLLRKLSASRRWTSSERQSKRF
ncbi:hypothetical protein CBR_g30300 [Chara braunii]|uniref:SHSP domain-containing protein n=1 Tax=Chara braunii TaxID=69332 RepID=A0A388JX29_CHABU|nr:hypothetical protein CBR_g30300 [Chara braunii]|eukprot:GBG62346.1 hypothetical protein CBR_g30300 [Chara braunii]